MYKTTESLAITVSHLLHSPLFILGLAVRLLLVVFAEPIIHNRWFLPFIETTIRHTTINPWTISLASGGGLSTFSDGPVMLLLFFPLTAIGMGADAFFDTAGIFLGLGFRVTLLLFDVIGLLLVLHVFAKRETLVMVVYWLSPLSLFIIYWHGQTDIVPVVLMIATFIALRRYEMRKAGAWLGLAVAAKFSMSIVVPFFFIHLWQNKRLRVVLPKFSVGLAITLMIALVPWILFSPGFRITVLGVIESAKLFGLVLRLNDGVEIYTLPLIYFLILYALWRLKRTNLEVLVAFIGVFLMILTLSIQTLPGSYLWALPFLVVYAAQTTRIGSAIVYFFMLLVVAMLFPVTSGADTPLVKNSLLFDHVETSAILATSLHMTLVTAVGLILTMRMYFEGVCYNANYRFSRKPLAIGIAGDSGTGKDTLAAVLRDLFGRHSVSTLFGDAYHKWDRSSPMWRAVTHLNPKANDLSAMSRDAISIITGGTVSKRHYDHRSGRFMRPTLIKPNDVVIIVGLHALFQPQLREKLDVKIFLNTDELLRLAWKAHRDTNTRGQEIAKLMEIIDARRADAEAYIAPQSQYADLIFMMMPINPEQVGSEEGGTHLPLKLRVQMRNSLYYEMLIKILIGICGLRIDWEIFEEGRMVEIIVEGDVCAGDICLAAKSLAPQLNELLNISPRWKDNMLGVMQLITLLEIDQSLRKRILE